MSDTNKKIENEKKPEIKQLTLEDLKRVRGGYADGGETALDDYNRDRCYKRCDVAEAL